MKDLFHFVQRRPTQTTMSIPVALSTGSPFQQTLRDLCGADDISVRDIRAEAERFIKGNAFASDPAALPLARSVLEFVDEAAKSSATAVADLVEPIFGASAESVAQDQKLADTFVRVADSLVALKVLSRAHTQSEALLKITRGIALLRRLAAGDASLTESAAVKRALAATALLPENIVPLPKPKPTAQPAATSDAVAARKQSPAAVAKNFESTLRELLRINAEDLDTSTDSESDSPNTSNTPDTPDTIPIVYAAPRLRARAVEKLSKSSKSVLATIGVDMNDSSWRDAVEKTRYALEEAIEHLYDNPDAISDLIPPDSPSATVPRLPRIQPAGFGDLIVVRQQIKAYEMGEIAHIENVMASESRERTHVRREYVETTSLVETETQRDRERDQQFTERFEMERETTKTISEEESLKAGATISASYGPFVEFTGSVDYETTEATEESSRQASQYAREISDRSVDRISERVREQQTRKVINEIEETNRHGFSNESGTSHICGVYQWLDKKYEAQAYKYDQRLLFDVIVPEPGMFLARALEKTAPEGMLPPKPEPFLLAANQINAVNYRLFAHRYQATVTPPPLLTLTEVKPFQHISDAESGSIPAFAEAVTIDLEPDYKAVSATLLRQSVHGEGSWSLYHWAGTSGLGETGKISAGIVGHNIRAVASAYEITCVPTPHALTQWQIDTHDAIMQAYTNQKTAYDQALSALLAENGSAILGRAPAENRRLERDEIKKFIISMLTNQDFSAYNAVEEAAAPGEGYPQIDIAKAEELGPAIRFFEQAFEWVNLTYVLYPYFWGRKGTWVDKLQIESADPLWVEFMRAGAARSVLPVRPGFERAVLHYLESGEIWNGGPVPDVTSALYLPILDEIKEHSGQTSESPTPYGESWEITLPTSLVKLREASGLPRWERQSDDSWHPVEES